MQLYVRETPCAQLPVIEASKNWNPSERRSVQFTENKVVEIGGENIQSLQSKLQRQSLDTWASYASKYTTEV